MKIAKQRIRLPRSLCREDNISGVIEELENLFQKNFIEWKNHRGLTEN